MLGHDVVMETIQWITSRQYHFIFKLFVEDESKLLTLFIFFPEFGSPNEFTYTQTQVAKIDFII